MGFIKAFTGALGGTFADEWKDFYVPRGNVPATAAIFGAEKKGTDAGRGENTKGSENIITKLLNADIIIITNIIIFLFLEFFCFKFIINHPC